MFTKNLVTQTCLCLILLSSVTFAEATPITQQIDDYVKQQKARHKIVGLSYAVMHNNQLLTKNAHGMANAQMRQEATMGTVYQLSSVTQIFTATAVHALAEQGLVELNKPIGDYLSVLPQKWHSVSVKRLLSHTSGLPDLVTVLNGYKRVDKLLAYLGSQPFEFHSGQDSSVNQTNFLLLKMLVEKVTGVLFEDHLVQSQFKPLGMSATQFATKHAMMLKLATSYRPKWGGIELRRDGGWPRFLFGGVGVNSSVEDMVRWFEALHSGKLLNEDSLNSMSATVRLNGGKAAKHSLGWELDKRGGYHIYGHDGAQVVDVRHFQKADTGVTVILLTNGAKTWFSPQEISQGIAQRILPGVQQPILKLGDQMYAALQADDVDSAVSIYAQFMQDSNNQTVNTELLINSAGYVEFGKGKLGNAIKLFKLNTEYHPDSGNAFDSLGEAYLQDKRMKLALFAYQKAVKLDPQNTRAQQIVDQIKQLYKNKSIYE